ncbi:MAG: DUF116 domain-containing protein [Methanospirillum sp.]|nr:DUF116 domain-containing protein [Methanospirillum sp.]
MIPLSDGTVTSLLALVGMVALLLIALVLLVAAVLFVLTLASIRSGRLYFPRLLRPGLTALEGLMRAIFKAVGLGEEEMLAFFVKLGNTMNARAFAEIPVKERAIFLPQCLRSAECPADLTPEGLRCKRCNRCSVGEAIGVLEGYGYRVFIVPGSTLIKRMVKKYRPRALIGVGCLSEVKEGLEMADRLGIVGLGVVTLRDGCVETLVDWPSVYETALLGLPTSTVSEDLHLPAKE